MGALTEEQHPLTNSSLCLSSTKVFLFSAVIMQSFVAAPLVGDFLKRGTASGPLFLWKKTGARHLCLLKVPCINFSSSQLSAIVTRYINQTMFAVCNKGVHKHTKTPWARCSGYTKICPMWICPFGVNIHLFIFFPSPGEFQNREEIPLLFFATSGFSHQHQSIEASCLVSAAAVMAATSTARQPKTSAARRCRSPARKCPAVRKPAGGLAPLNRRAKPAQDSHAYAHEIKAHLWTRVSTIVLNDAHMPPRGRFSFPFFF